MFLIMFNEVDRDEMIPTHLDMLLILNETRYIIDCHKSNLQIVLVKQDMSLRRHDIQHTNVSKYYKVYLPGVSEKSKVKQIIAILRMVTHSNVIFSDMITLI